MTIDSLWTYANILHLIAADPSNRYGLHGYDNKYLSMKSMFAAWGPAIRPIGRIEPFETTRLLPTWAHILDLSLANQAGPFDPEGAVKNLLVSETASAALSAKAPRYDVPMPIAFVVGYLTCKSAFLLFFLSHNRTSPKLT